MGPRDTPHGQVALAFAQALSAGEYTTAHGMLAQSLRESITAGQLKSEFEAMIDAEAGSAVFVDVMMVLDDWPAKEKGDVGWAYCAVGGEVYSEGVTVVVTSENGSHLIRSIEWGRP
jgi:hypothetical protein